MRTSICACLLVLAACSSSNSPSSLADCCVLQPDSGPVTSCWCGTGPDSSGTFKTNVQGSTCSVAFTVTADGGASSVQSVDGRLATPSDVCMTDLSGG